MVLVDLGAHAVGRRIDVALVDRLAELGVDVTRSSLRRTFAAGGVRVGAKVVKPSAVVEDEIKVEVELVRPPPLAATPEPIPLDVLHEDEAILVVDKPAGMVVHPSLGHTSGTLVSAVLHHLGVTADALPLLEGNDATRPGIVHRLDRFTSGVMVVAKSAAAARVLAQQFQRHSIERRYWGLMRGVVPFDEERIETGHARDPTERRRFAARTDARRRAITRVRVLYRTEAVTSAQFKLETGRTHQNRMHARHLGHPIFGDALYARPPSSALLREPWLELERHALHAEVLGFEHPGGHTVRFESPLPTVLCELCDTLGIAHGEET